MGTPHDLTELNSTIDAQVEIVSDLIDPYLDLQADHHGELARYGDSWPGAVDQISRAGAALQAAQHVLWDLLTTRDAMYPFIGPIHTAEEDEEPFLWPVTHCSQTATGRVPPRCRLLAYRAHNISMPHHTRLNWQEAGSVNLSK